MKCRDDFLQQREMIGVGNGADFLDELFSSFDAIRKMFNTGFSQRPARSLQGNEFIEAVGRKPAGPSWMALEPVGNALLDRPPLHDREPSPEP